MTFLTGESCQVRIIGFPLIRSYRVLLGAGAFVGSCPFPEMFLMFVAPLLKLAPFFRTYSLVFFAALFLPEQLAEIGQTGFAFVAADQWLRAGAAIMAQIIAADLFDEA